MATPTTGNGMPRPVGRSVGDGTLGEFIAIPGTLIAGYFLQWNGSAFVMASAAASLDDLTDVNAGPANDGDVLTWSNANSQWESQAPLASVSLDDLADVSAAAPNTNDILVYNGADWVAAAPTVPDLDDLGDVAAAGPNDGDVLTYDSGTGNWTAEAPAAPAVPDLDDLGDVAATGPSDGDVLTYNSGTGNWTATAGGGGGSMIQDADGDTSIDTDVSDDDSIYFVCGGTFVATMSGDAGVARIVSHGASPSNPQFTNNGSSAWGLGFNISSSEMYLRFDGGGYLTFNGTDQTIEANGSTFLAPAGTRTKPAFACTSNPDTGMYFFGTTAIYMSVNDSDVFWISGTNANFATNITVGTGGHYLRMVNHGGAPTALGNSALLYANDVTASSEMFVLDEAGNETQISPHPGDTAIMERGANDAAVPFGYSSRNLYTGERTVVDLLLLARLVEQLANAAGLDATGLVTVSQEAPATYWDDNQARLSAEAQARGETYEAKDPPAWLADRLAKLGIPRTQPK